MSKQKKQMNAPDREQGSRINKDTAKRLLSYIGAYKKTLVVVFICIILSALASVASAMFIEILIDDYITPILAMDHPVYTGLIKALFMVGIIYLIGVFSTWFYNYLMVGIAQGTLKTIRDEMFEKMQSLPIRYFDTHTHGDVMSCYTNDTDTLRQMIAQSLSQMISSICMVVAVFCCMLYQSIYLTLIVVVMLFFIMKLVKVIGGKSGFYFIKQQQTLGALDGYIEEMVNGQKVVKVFCHEEKAREDFRKKNQEWQQAATGANGYASGMMPMMNALGYVQYVVVAVVGAWLAISGATNLTLVGTNTATLGMIASFLTLSKNFTNPISQLSNQFNAIVTALAGAERIFKLIDEEPEVDNGYVTLANVKEENGELVEVKERTGIWAWKHPHEDGSLTYQKLEGDIVLDHVDFSYNPDKQILRDVTLYAKPGQKIAFVGATGAGKTTITNLINRFYDIDDGKIRYDGININKIRKKDLRASLGIVLQEVNLFTGTVMENLKYGNPNATDEECIAAAKLANAHNFIMMLPNGYDTVLAGDGSGLSQGQRQLISIARAAVSNPPVMILDEATSSIDTRTEAMVQQGMDRLMEGRTVFVIAHRLSTVKNSDVIMVLDHGAIIERGTHEDLIAKKGTYYQLYTGAFELE
jgi:ATP-binding cassette subfamily B multidrug efflux pump